MTARGSGRGGDGDIRRVLLAQKQVRFAEEPADSYPEGLHAHGLVGIADGGLHTRGQIGIVGGSGGEGDGDEADLRTLTGMMNAIANIAPNECATET